MYHRLFLSHKLCWLSEHELKATLPKLVEVLYRFAEEIFCSYEYVERMKENEMTEEQNYARCLEQQKKADIVVWFLHYPETSWWMEQELQQAITDKQPYILLEKQIERRPSFYNEFEQYAQKIYTYASFDELLQQLQAIKELV